MMFWKKRPPPAPLTPDAARLARLRNFLPHINKLGWWGSPDGTRGITELRQEVRFALEVAEQAERTKGQANG